VIDLIFMVTMLGSPRLIGVVRQSNIFNESEMARSSECTEQYAQKVLDTAGIVREAM